MVSRNSGYNIMSIFNCIEVLEEFQDVCKLSY